MFLQRFQHIMLLIINFVFSSGLSYEGRRHSAKLSTLSVNLTATCHEILQDRGLRAGLGRLENLFFYCCRLSSLLFWDNLALPSRKLIWGRSCQIGKHYLFHALVKCRSHLQRKQILFLPFSCMMVLRSRRQTLLLSWQHLLMYCVFSPFSLYCGNL